MKIKGLTLIEVMIAITILSSIMISVVIVTNDSVEHKNLVVKEDRELLQIETALERLGWDFLQIYTPLYHTKALSKSFPLTDEVKKRMRKLRSNPLYYPRGERFKEPDYFGRPIPFFKVDSKDSIEFYTKANRRRFQDSKESEFAWVRYEFRPYRGDDPDKKDFFELVRYYSAANIYKPDLRLENLKPTTLSNKILDYKFLFWDDKNSKWIEQFKSIGNDDSKIIIRGLKININWVRGEEKTKEFATRTYRMTWPYFNPENLSLLKTKNSPTPPPPTRD